MLVSMQVSLDTGNARMTYRENAIVRVSLKQAMRDRGWDQKTVADAIGLKQQSVSSFLRGQTGVRRQTAMKIAELLELDFASLMAQANVERLSELSPVQRERLEWIVDRFERPVRPLKLNDGEEVVHRPSSVEKSVLMGEASGIPGAVVAERIRAIRGPKLAPQEDADLQIYEQGRGDFDDPPALTAAYETAVQVMTSAAKGQLTYQDAVRIARAAIEVDVGGTTALAILDGYEEWAACAVQVADRIIVTRALLRQRAVEEDEDQDSGESAGKGTAVGDVAVAGEPRTYPIAMDTVATRADIEKFFRVGHSKPATPPNRAERRSTSKKRKPAR